jgi:hypothetical protein
MKNIYLTWKISWSLTLIFFVASIISFTLSGLSLYESLVTLTRGPFDIFSAIFNPFSFWAGLSLSSQHPTAYFIGCLLSLLALLLIIVGIFDLFRKNQPTASN